MSDRRLLLNDDEPPKKKQKMDDSVARFIDEIFENSNNSKKKLKWMDNLTDEEKEVYGLQYQTIKDAIKKRIVSEVDIMKSNLPFDEKIYLIEQLNVLKNTQKRTQEYYSLKKLIYDKIKEDDDMELIDIETEKKIKDFNNNIFSMKKRILRSTHDIETKNILYQKYISLSNMDHDDEYHKNKKWIEHVLNVPTIIKPIFKSNDPDELIKKINSVKIKMDTILYGQKHAKERILEILSAIFINPSHTRSCIAFIGKPGVGKTIFARCLADALELPFYQISLGGVTDAHHIVGHSSTYVGAKYGQIVSALVHMKQKNGILFLDEFDKLKDKGSDVSDAFLHILDYSQNHEFRDEYMPEIPIDLSNLFIIISLNELDELNKIVADRLPLVTFTDYDFDDKINIVSDYIVPKLEKQLGFEKGEIIISKDVIEYIINKSIHCDAPGVRHFERNITRIYERINALKMTRGTNIKFSYGIDNFKIPLELTYDIIDILFDEYLEEE